MWHSGRDLLCGDNAVTIHRVQGWNVDGRAVTLEVNQGLWLSYAPLTVEELNGCRLRRLLPEVRLALRCALLLEMWETQPGLTINVVSLLRVLVSNVLRCTGVCVCVVLAVVLSFL